MTMTVNPPSDFTCAAGEVRYVAANGDDGNDGKSPETAWHSLARLNAGLPAGGTARLRRGDVFYGTLEVMGDPLARKYKFVMAILLRATVFSPASSDAASRCRTTRTARQGALLALLQLNSSQRRPAARLDEWRHRSRWRAARRRSTSCHGLLRVALHGRNDHGITVVTSWDSNHEIRDKGRDAAAQRIGACP